MTTGSTALPTLGDKGGRGQEVSELSPPSLREQELLDPYFFALWKWVTTLHVSFKPAWLKTSEYPQWHRES